MEDNQLLLSLDSEEEERWLDGDDEVLDKYRKEDREQACLDPDKTNSQEGSRRVHPKRRKAMDLADERRLDWWMDKEAEWVNYTLALFKEYHLDIGSKVLGFSRFNEIKKEQEYMYRDYVTRFDEEYKDELRAKFQSLERFDNFVEVEITVDMKRFTSIGEACSKLNESFDKVKRALNEKVGRNLDYLRCLEVYGDKTETINPHLHILFFGIKYLVQKDYIIEKVKKYGLGENINVSSGRELEEKDAVSYAVKHATGGATKKSEDGEVYFETENGDRATKGGDLRYCSLIWATNKRTWSVSRSLLNTRSNGDVFGDMAMFLLDFLFAGSKWHFEGTFYTREFEERPETGVISDIPPPV